ncbi:RidA family protein [Siculibacillus lacustris]|uniref:RidA family protein n=1 Tax=Siculibacillus lacustris TaxID=1549641 RepID=A0A4V2KSV0_9HYPH|nr:Rid family detoxifying hydrolase [Siculibacillus lacustris]TBW34496.1 RidA family protein [Siculibacillus lacustris]
MSRKAHAAAGAVAVGPYSHAVEANGFVHLSGQTPIDPATGRLVDGDVGVATTQCLENLFAVLAAAGLGPDDVVSCAVYLTDMADFPAMNAAYARAFAEPYPARTTIGVAALPLGARVEIGLIAARPPRAV